jgi:cellobiose phosphorylase
LLRAEEDSIYDLPTRSSESATVYEHCVRAIKHGLRFGEHGLPLIGCGDWNDGMNLVGDKGKGESVWLAFFLYDVLTKFAALAKQRNDSTVVTLCESEALKLRTNIEAHAWDGNWYLRAYFDDGRPLGSAANPECRIDSLPQSWSILSGAGDAERSLKGMTAIDQQLVRRDIGIIELFDPPFDKSDLNPGYVKGYVPGVRENGGQYTRRVCQPPAHRSRRVDLVYRLRRLDVSADHRVTAGNSSGSGPAEVHALHSAGLENLQAALSLSRDGVSHLFPEQRRRESHQIDC